MAGAFDVGWADSERGPRPGTLCGRYELGELLGRGGMGEVRAGRDLRLHRDVAIKLLYPEMARQPTVRRRFESEARSAARFSHPHVVAVFDFGQDAGVPFLVMERLTGRTLADVIDEGPMEPEAAHRLAVEVLDALTAAHRAGLVHRDIKPANVLAAGPHGWKLGDFGIAKSVTTSDPDLTAVGMIIGTPAYLAPERLAGREATPGSDVYAVGVILYEALVGRRSQDRDDRLPAFVQPRPPLDRVRPGLPGDLVAVVGRATALDPANRFTSAPEMLRALNECGPPPPSRPLPRTAVGPQQFVAAKALDSDRHGAARRRLGFATLAGAAGAAALIALWPGARRVGPSPTIARSPAVSSPAPTTTTIATVTTSTTPTTALTAVIKKAPARPAAHRQDGGRGQAGRGD